uniref:Uncharacterized protein n=1 Tax=Acrobeloides nanus TaxID=290746 RepID=A0A914D1T4_9BILA
MMHAIGVQLNEEHTPYRYIMFDGQAIFPLDIIIILLGTFMSSITFIISMLSMRALSASYDQFNQEVKNLVKDNRLNDFSSIIAIENRVMDYNKLAKHVYNADATYISMTIMKGLIIHISAQFGLRAYSENAPVLLLIVLGNWTALGIVMFFPFMLRPMEYYIKMLFVIMFGIDIFSAYWKKLSTIDDNPRIEFSNFNMSM